MTDTRMTSGLTGAAAGSGAGFAIGNVPGAIVGGLAGAGLGVLSSWDTAQAENALKAEMDRRLAYLQMLKKTGQMGLNPQELAALEGKLIDPLRAQFRQNQEQALAGAAASGGSPGQYFQANIGQDTRVAEHLQPSYAKIADLDAKKAAQQEAEIMALLNNRYQIEAKDTAQMMNALDAAGKAAAGIGEDISVAKAQQEAADEILGQPSEDPDYEELDSNGQTDIEYWA